MANLPSWTLNPRETSWVKTNMNEEIQLGLAFFVCLVLGLLLFFGGVGGDNLICFFVVFFFQERTAGKKKLQKLTYTQVVAYYPSPSKGSSHMPRNIKHTIAQYYLVTSWESHQTEWLTNLCPQQMARRSQRRPWAQPRGQFTNSGSQGSNWRSKGPFKWHPPGPSSEA